MTEIWVPGAQFSLSDSLPSRRSSVSVDFLYLWGLSLLSEGVGLPGLLGFDVLGKEVGF